MKGKEEKKLIFRIWIVENFDILKIIIKIAHSNSIIIPQII